MKNVLYKETQCHRNVSSDAVTFNSLVPWFMLLNTLVSSALRLKKYFTWHFASELTAVLCKRTGSLLHECDRLSGWNVLAFAFIISILHRTYVSLKSLQEKVYTCNVFYKHAYPAVSINATCNALDIINHIRTVGSVIHQRLSLLWWEYNYAPYWHKKINIDAC